MAQHDAVQDRNRVHTLLALQGSTGTANTGTETVAVGADGTTGALYVYNLAPAGSLSVGSITVSAIDSVGTINTGTITAVEALPDLPGGTIDQITGGSIVVTAGTVTTTLALNTGTITTGSLAAIGQVHNAGTIAGLPDLPGGTIDQITGGSIVVTAGTVTTTLALDTGTITTGSLAAIGQVHNAGTVAALPDLPGGTIDQITTGSIVVTAGTVTTTLALDTGTITTGSLAAIGQVHNAGTVAGLPDLPGGTIDQLTTGSIIVTAGTFSAAAGTGFYSDTIDANNTTTGTITASGTYTGTATDVLGYSAVTINIATDQDSASNGMKFQFSSDGTNWDDTYSFDYAGTSAARRFQFPVTSRYYRGQFINGTVGQSYFRYQTILHRQNVLTTIHRLDTNVGVDRSANLVKAALIAQINGTGEFTPIQANSAGVLKVGGGIDVSSLVDLPGGTIDLVTRVGNVGTLEVGTISTLPNIPGGTLGVVSAVSMLNAGTLTTIPNIPGGTIGVVSNITNGTIRITAGTVNSLVGGTLGLVTTVTNLSNGTIQNSGTTTGVGTVSNIAVVHNAGTVQNINFGTVRLDPRPSKNVLSYGTTFGGTAAGYGTLVGSAAVGAGTYTWVQDISVNNPYGTVRTMVGFGTALQGTSCLVNGIFGTQTGVGIQKSYSDAVNAGMTNQDLVVYIGGAGTVDVNVSYYISA